VHHYNPEEKRQLVEYLDNNSFCPKKLKVQVPTGKNKCGDDNIFRRKNHNPFGFYES
jgi:hypothetical protein